jgi:hypothetical protein
MIEISFACRIVAALALERGLMLGDELLAARLARRAGERDGAKTNELEPSATHDAVLK